MKWKVENLSILLKLTDIQLGNCGDWPSLKGMKEPGSAQRAVMGYSLPSSGGGVLKRCCKVGRSWHFLSGILK